ncbi:MAG: hypothetical protein ACOH5I_12395 [Oligoflexus sp.]
MILRKNLFLFIYLGISGVLHAQNAAPEAKVPALGGEPGWRPPESKTFTEKEIQAECRKYQGKLISYYTQVFKIENCQRREILSDEYLQAWTKKAQPIFSVESDTIIKIPEGKPIELVTEQKSFHCRQVEGRYVITGASDIFYVEKCQRRAFPDWETFVAHRNQHKLTKKPIIDLTEDEFRQLAPGKDFPTVLDEIFQNAIDVDAEVDVIPIDEACRGLNEKYVTYYSRVYRIERCRKREVIDPDFSSLKQLSQKKVIELSSEQWISIPDGEPLNKL